MKHLRHLATLLGALILGALAAASPALAAGLPLTMTSPVYDTTTPISGSVSLKSGYGSPSTNWVPTSNTNFALEFKTRGTAIGSTSPAVAVSVSANIWLGESSGGYAQAGLGNSGAGITATVAAGKINDGNPHTEAVSCGPSTCNLFVDGTNVGSTPSSNVAPGTPYHTVIGAYSATGSNAYPNEIDDAVLWNTNQYPTTGPAANSTYTGTEGMADLYQFESQSGADTATPPGVNIAPNNAAIYYSGGPEVNWHVTSTSAKAVNSGAYLKTTFTGSSLTLGFSPQSSAPTSPAGYPEAIVYVDDRRVFSGPVSTSSVSITMPTDTTGFIHHTLEIDVKGVSEQQDRWNTPLGALNFTGLTLASGSTVTLPTLQPKSMWCFGDSITEGSWVMAHPGSPSSDATYWDGSLSWCQLQRRFSGVEVAQMGFSATSLEGGGVAASNVPSALSSWNLIYSGVSRSFSNSPNLVLINQGHNIGSGVSDAQTVTDATNYLNDFVGATPSSTAIVWLEPFNPSGDTQGKNYRWADIQQAVATVQAANPGRRILAIPSTSVPFTGAESADGTHPYGSANLESVGPAVAALLAPVLYPSLTAGTSRSGTLH